MDNELLCPKAITLVDKVFGVFYALCAGFDRQFQDSNKLKIIKAQWVIGFMENNFEQEKDLESGLAHLRKTSNIVFIPQLGDFITWCQQSKKDLLLPKEKAYRFAFELMRNDLSEPLSADQILILRHTIKACDSHFLKTSPRTATEPVFYRNYEITCRDFFNGELKPIPKAISHYNNDDPWKTMKKYGLLPQFAHLNSRDKAMPVIMELIQKNGGNFTKGLPYDKHKRSKKDNI